MTKPRVKIKDCFVIGKHLYGIPLNHPDKLNVSGESLVRTSEIVAHHSTRCIETRNTIYEIENWSVPETQHRL